MQIHLWMRSRTNWNTLVASIGAVLCPNTSKFPVHAMAILNGHELLWWGESRKIIVNPWTSADVIIHNENTSLKWVETIGMDNLIRDYAKVAVTIPEMVDLIRDFINPTAKGKPKNAEKIDWFAITASSVDRS